MADIEGIMRELDWQLEWLEATEPSNFKDSAAKLGVEVGSTDVPAALVAHFVKLLEQGRDEAFARVFEDFLDGLEVGTRPSVLTKPIFNHLHECLERDEVDLPDPVTKRGDPPSGGPTLFDEPPEPPVSRIVDRTQSRKLFSGKDLARVIATATTYQNETARNQYDKIATDLGKIGPYRDFGFAPDVLSALDKLAEDLPNFSAVIEHIADAINLAITSQRPLVLDPILIVSEPGIGKSYFVNRLHEVLGVPSARLSFDNLQLGGSLAGAEPIWSTSQPGIVFTTIAASHHLSPIISLDEIDKASMHHAYGDPLSPLHTLLEPESARYFTDGCFPLPIDVSHIIWIATANRRDRLDPPLASRFLSFKLSRPTPSQRRVITSSVVAALLRNYDGMAFTDEVIDRIGEFSPRRQRQLLTSSLARARRCGESRVSLGVLTEVINRTDLDQRPEKTLGFGVKD